MDAGSNSETEEYENIHGFEIQEDDELWEVEEILKENKTKYLVRWSGVDPATDKPWPDSWELKSNVTPKVVFDWKQKLEENKKQKALERKAKKMTRKSTSTTSRESSKASSSRLTSRPSVRSRRSNATIAAERDEDSDETQHKSISRNDKKRRLSKTAGSSEDEEARPLPSRPAKKPRIISSSYEDVKPPSVRPVTKGSASHEIQSAARPNGKGKGVDKSPIPLPRKSRSPAKNGSLPPPLQRRPVDHEDGTSFYDQIPDNRRRTLSRARTPPSPLQSPEHTPQPLADDEPRISMKLPHRAPKRPRAAPRSAHSSSEDDPALDVNDPGRASSHLQTTPSQPISPEHPRVNGAIQILGQPPLSPRSPELSYFQSQLLSPGGQARLEQFDKELASPTQPQDVQKTPLFLPTISPATSVEPEEPRYASRSPSDSPPPLAPRPLSPSVTDPAPSPPPPPVRQGSSRRTMDNSYRVGDVPETQSLRDAGSSPQREPPVTPRTKKSVIAQMRPRSKHSSSLPSSPRTDVVSAATARPLGRIPLMSESQFKSAVQAGLEEEDEADEPQDSIEQFSSPEKGSTRKALEKAAARERRLVELKARARSRGEEDDEDADDEEAHERLLRHGEKMAEAERVKRRAQTADYDVRRKGTTLDEILKQTQTQRDEEGISMSVTEPDMPSLLRQHPPVDIEALRQEEEENTQDVMAYINFSDPVAGDGQEAADDGDADHSVVAESVASTADRSMGHETDAEGSIYEDGAERVAWNEEHASQQRLGDNLSQDQPEDDSFGEELLYPDEEVVLPAPQSDLVPPSQSREGMMQDISAENTQPPPADPVPVVPPIPNGRSSKSKSRSRSRSASAGAREGEPENSSLLVLPPTAPTRQNTPEPQPAPVETELTSERRLEMSLLNLKSDENRRLEAQLADERTTLIAVQAENVALNARIEKLTADAQNAAPASDSELANRLKLAEELLAVERASLAAALQAKVAAEAERDIAKRDLGNAEQQCDTYRESYMKASLFAEEQQAENKALQQRAQIAEEAAKSGVALFKATFDQREVALKAEIRDWRNQAVFLREQAVRTNDDELRRRAAEYPELVDRYKRLVDENDRLEKRVENAEDEVLVKEDDNQRLDQRLIEVTEELDNLKGSILSGDTQVFRCGWRSVDNVPCPVLCRTRDDLAFHALMHVAHPAGQ